MWKPIFICVLVAFGCQEKRAAKPDAGRVALRDKIETPPPPPIARPVPPSAAGIPARIHPGPTRGAPSPEGLAKALVAAVKKSDADAFLDLTVSARDIGLSFHPGVQTAIREVVGRLAGRFLDLARDLGAGAEVASFKPGLLLDFQKGQGAKEPMPGQLNAEIIVAAGGGTKRVPLERIVRIEGRWKILDL